MSETKPNIALAHEFLVQFGGAEKTFDAIAELFPDAPIYTAKFDKQNISKMAPKLAARNIISPRNYLINNASKYIFTFMMAPVFENMDFRGFDMVISDGNTWNKGILLKPDQMHITYMHTPPRFLYKYSTESTRRDKWYFRLPFSYIDNMLRMWDYIAAQRPEYIIANSQEVARRIKKFYRRDATVIYPPVDVNVGDNYEKDNIGKPYFIIGGRLQKYKNFDIVVNAFTLLGIPLVVMGTGEQEKYLKSLAGPNITFTGAVSEQEKHKLIHNALGLINPVVDEDFGIVPVEAMAHGIPVLVHKSGGHLESVQENINGMFFEELKLDSLVEAIKDFNEKIRAGKFNKDAIKQSVQKFSKERFQKEFNAFVQGKWEEFKKNA